MPHGAWVVNVYILQVELPDADGTYTNPGNPFATVGVYASLDAAMGASGVTPKDTWVSIANPSFGPTGWWESRYYRSEDGELIDYRIEQQEVLGEP